MAVTDQQKREIKALLSSGRKIEAIKYIRENFQLDLKQSKLLVDHIEEEMEPSEFHKTIFVRAAAKTQKGCGGKFIGLFFAVTGFIMLGIVTWIYLDQENQISESILVVGSVVSNPSQPTIEYSYKGNNYYCYATVTSNPPSYDIGEEVEIYINKNDPEITLINTITERWFVIILLGGMGVLFSGLGLLVYKIL
jgi:hypothetical protein